MPQFSRASRITLLGCHHDLQRILVAAERHYRLEVVAVPGSTDPASVPCKPKARRGTKSVMISSPDVDPDVASQRGEFIEWLVKQADRLYSNGIIAHLLRVEVQSDKQGRGLFRCELVVD